MKEIDPQAWLADVLAQIKGLPQTRSELLLWNSKTLQVQAAAV